MTIQDWPVSYDELEPHYDYFDKICGVSGKAGNLRGKKIDGGNVFEGPRSNHYPNEPIKSSNAGLMFGEAAKSLGYHPFPAPIAIASNAYTNAEGVPLGACEYCGYCNRIACETNAKASPNSTILPSLRLDPKFEIRTRAFVTKLNYDKAAKKVVSVSYVDMRNGEEYEQPAGIVLLTSYVFSNAQHMLLAGIGEPYDHATGKGVVGKNYAYQFEAGASAFFENKEINPYWGNAGMGVVIDDFNGESFDHGGLGFFGGGYIAGGSARRAADRRPHRAARHAGMGFRMEARDGQVVLPRRAFQYAGLGLCQSRQLHGPRPDVQGCAWPAAGPAHLQSARQRIQNVGLSAGQARGCHQGNEPDALRHASAAQDLHRRSRISRPTIPAAR